MAPSTKGAAGARVVQDNRVSKTGAACPGHGAKRDNSFWWRATNQTRAEFATTASGSAVQRPASFPPPAVEDKLFDRHSISFDSGGGNCSVSMRRPAYAFACLGDRWCQTLIQRPFSRPVQPRQETSASTSGALRPLSADGVKKAWVGLANKVDLAGQGV